MLEPFRSDCIGTKAVAFCIGAFSSRDRAQLAEFIAQVEAGRWLARDPRAAGPNHAHQIDGIDDRLWMRLLALAEIGVTPAGGVNHQALSDGVFQISNSRRRQRPLTQAKV